MTGQSSQRPDHDIVAFGARVLFVHAHPDDEAISTGGTISALLRAGADVLIVTATRGERGEVMPGPLQHLEGTPELVPVRVAEAARAVDALGGPDHVFLGSGIARQPDDGDHLHEDSGMVWGPDGLAAPAPDSSPSAFSRASFAHCVADLAAAASAFSPTSVVSYDHRGGYGHPDHIRCHQIAREVARQQKVPLWMIAEPRVAAPPDAGPISVRLVMQEQDLARKKAAMAAHSTQLRIDGEEFTLTGGQTHQVAREESFRLHS